MIDDKIIAVYQHIVDESEKKPGWWSEQSIMAATTLDIVIRVLNWSSGWDAVMLLICMVVAAMLVKVARNEVFLKSISSNFSIRAFFLGLIAFQAFVMFTSDTMLYELMRMITSIFFVSYYYFACCENPRPKKRKEKLVPTAA
jgi:hypothetical protein